MRLLQRDRRTPAALEVRGLPTDYELTTILRVVSITVPASQVTALLGPNGAGKTTLLRAVSRFLPAQKGTVTLFGDDVTKLSAVTLEAESESRC